MLKTSLAIATLAIGTQACPIGDYGHDDHDHDHDKKDDKLEAPSPLKGLAGL